MHPPYESHEFDLIYESFDQLTTNSNSSGRSEHPPKTLGEDLREDLDRAGFLLNNLSVRPFFKQMIMSSAYNASRRQAGFVILAIILVICAVIFPSTSLIIGMSTFNKCPEFPQIPKFLLFFGIVILGDVFFNFGIFGIFIEDEQTLTRTRCQAKSF